MNTAAIERLYQLFGEGRTEDTFALMHPSVRLLEPGDPTLIPWAGEFHGHKGLRQFYAGLTSGLSEIEIDPHTLRILQVNETLVLVLGTERGVSAATGRCYVSDSAWLWEIIDGRIRAMQAFHDTEAMASAMRSNDTF